MDWFDVWSWCICRLLVSSLKREKAFHPASPLKGQLWWDWGGPMDLCKGSRLDLLYGGSPWNFTRPCSLPTPRLWTYALHLRTLPVTEFHMPIRRLTPEKWEISSWNDVLHSLRTRPAAHPRPWYKIDTGKRSTYFLRTSTASYQNFHLTSTLSHARAIANEHIAWDLNLNLIVSFAVYSATV